MNSKELFTKKSYSYDKYRQSYSDALYEYIFKYCNITPQHTIADIGSGTGLFSEQFIKSGINVFCVEPNKHMRDIAEEKLNIFNNFHSISGDYEHTTLEEDSINIITVAQAFHYFNPELFLKECKRIVKNNNDYVIIVWNRKIDNSLDRERRALAEKYCPKYLLYSKASSCREQTVLDFFRHDNGLVKISFPNDIYNTYDDFLGRTLTAYYALDASDENYCTYVYHLTKYFEKHAVAGKIVIPNETVAYIGRLGN